MNRGFVLKQPLIMLQSWIKVNRKSCSTRMDQYGTMCTFGDKVDVFYIRNVSSSILERFRISDSVSTCTIRY